MTPYEQDVESIRTQTEVEETTEKQIDSDSHDDNEEEDDDDNLIETDHNTGSEIGGDNKNREEMEGMVDVA
jgi:hypothetical protein